MPGIIGIEGESEFPVEEGTGLESAMETGAEEFGVEILDPTITDDFAVSGRD
jgi:hypothetical protein